MHPTSNKDNQHSFSLGMDAVFCRLKKCFYLNVCVIQEFLCWLCVRLLEVLLPGASFSKCLMSLHLLGLLGQIFTFSTGMCTALQFHSCVKEFSHSQYDFIANTEYLNFIYIDMDTGIHIML